MIKRFADKFMNSKDQLRAGLKKHPESYSDLVRLAMSVLADEYSYEDAPDPERIHEINDGDYQGTLVYVIAANGYQPRTYWTTMVDYGSCGGCDTLQSIQDADDYRGYSRESGWSEPTEESKDQYMTLMLHLVQGMRPMYGPLEEDL